MGHAETFGGSALKSSSPTILITGGAGYIGTSVAYCLREKGYTPILFDNFSTSRPPKDSSLKCVQVELTDRTAFANAWEKAGKIDAVLHFAAKALVPESMRDPYAYFHNNTLATLNTAELCIKYGTRHIVHSSSCTVYGMPDRVPITEACRLSPMSPYGESKVISERILGSYHGRDGLRVIHLRYFNPSGALLKYDWGESHDPETHAVPNLVGAIVGGRSFSIFGDDYDTPDGTCVRDFIHIEDLASAHALALDFVRQTGTERALAVNLGAGRGTSLRALVTEAEKALKQKIQVAVTARREGDPPTLFADITMAKKVLGFSPQRSLTDILVSHFQWAQKTLK